MHRKKAKGRMIAIAVVLAMICPILSFAQGVIDTDKQCSLTLSCIAGEDKAVSGMTVDIYKIADTDECGNSTLTPEFEKYKSFIDLDDLGGTNGDKVAKTLEEYIARDGVEPQGSETSDSAGNVIFGNCGTAGMYLVIGHSFVKDLYGYEMTPFLISLPDRVDETNSWNYDVKALPKCVSEYVPDVADYSVTKVWNDEGNEKSRPECVTIELLKDGEIYDTVKLSSENNWKHSWKDLDTAYEWEVTEKEMSGYMVFITENNHSFVVENTFIEGDTPSTGDAPPAKGTKLPQTGQLWWPVVVLVIAGLSFIVAGMIRKNRASEK